MTNQRPVVLLTNAVPPDKFGGLERYVRELASSLVGRGHHVTLLAKRILAESPEREVTEDGVHLVRYAVPGKSDPFFAAKYPFAVRRAVEQELLRTGTNSVLHGHFSVTTLPAALKKLPYVFTFHAPVYKELLSERQDSYWLPRPVRGGVVAGLRAAERRVVTKARRLVILSEFMREELGYLDSAAGCRAELVPGGIDTDRFVLADTVESDSAEGPLLLCVRRLTPRTGVEELVAAMPSIVARHPGTRLVVLGEGQQRSQIERAIANHCMQDSVSLVGRVSDEELVGWYQKAMLVVMPTQELEGFGLSSGEAMACGTPVVATPVGANSEVIGRLDRSLVAAGSTPSDIADVVVHALSDTARLGNLRGRARSAVHPALSWETVAAAHADIYASLEDS